MGIYFIIKNIYYYIVLEEKYFPQ